MNRLVWPFPKEVNHRRCFTLRRRRLPLRMYLRNGGNGGERVKTSDLPLGQVAVT
ncbi:MAG: hypothetical protein IKM62_04455 [Kiritimatiellae bacterium]|nr:hypothetical protein [Kiritimatiellia bacterium]